MTTPTTTPEATCTAPDCERGVHARGLCRAHYARHLRGTSDEVAVRPARLGDGGRARLTVSLSERLREAVEVAAAARHTTPSALVRSLLATALGVE